MASYRYYGKINGKTVKGPISASSMQSAILTVAKAYGLGNPSCETDAEVVHLMVNGSAVVEITTVGSNSKRAAKVQLT